MSATIDERIVEMRFDNKQFESNVQTSMSTLDKLKQSLNLTGASKGIENVSTAAKKCDMSGLSNAVQTVQAKFSTLEVMAITALANITNSAVNTGKKIISALTMDPITAGFEEYETQINAVQTILANTSSKGTTLQQVNAALDELNTYADKTIYNFTEMTRNIGTFTAAGVDLKTSVGAIKGIANLAAVSGSTSQQASTAMYQLSQALASGTVKLMDWNSVVNAGMGGAIFQDSLKETARVHGIAIDQMIEGEGSFRETLKDGWLTSNILTETLSKFTGDLNERQLKTMGYTQEQITEIMKLGDMANKAATEVKTFSQLWDTLKEAAQSGWTQSWQLIIGDFGEAKTFLTEVSDTIGKIIGDSADLRNEMLSGGLSTGWKQFLRKGIDDEAGYKDAIQSTAKEHGIALDAMIEKEGSFEDTLKSGWLTADIMTESLEKLTSETRGLSDEQLEQRGYTREQIDALEALNESVQNGSISVEEFANKMKDASGRENLIQALRNAFDGLISVVTPISEAFREIFPPYTAEQLYALTEALKNFTEKLKLSETTSDNLKRTFKGLFAVLDIIQQAFSAVLNVILPLFGEAEGLRSGILGVTAGFGDWIVKLDESIKTTDIFNKVLQGMVDFVKLSVTTIKDFIQAVAEKFNFPGFEIFHSFLERIHERMSEVGDATGSMKSGVVTAIDVIGEALANSKFLQAFQALWDGVTAIACGIVKAIGGLAGSLADKIGNADFDTIFDLINTAALGGIGIVISKFLKNLSEPIEGFQGMLEGVTGILDGVRGCFEAYQTQLKAGTLLKIASAIGILAVAILIISMIDSEKLSASLGAITVLFAELMVSMSLFGNVSGNLTGAFKTCTAMIGISIAVLILATALQKIGELDFKEMATGLFGVIGLTATMVAAAKIMGSNATTITNGATQMVIFAVAIKILASACEDLSKLSWDELAKGLVGVGVLMAEISLFLNTAKFSGKSVTTATGIVILAAAIKILASACEDFAKMQWNEVGKGLTSIGILLAEIAIFTKLTGNAQHVISTGIALIAIGTAMKIFVSAIQDMANMTWEDLAKGLTGMAGALIAVTIALNFMPKNMIGIGIGLIAVSTALVIIANVLDKMGGMSWDEIARGLAALGGSITILAIGLNAMNGTLTGSAALLVAAASLAILAPTLSILGAMSWEAIAKGLVAIAGAFVVIGVAGLVLTPLVPTIIALGGAFTLIGLGILGIGAGLLLAGTGLSALAVGFTALAAFGVAGATAVVASLTVIITGIMGLIPVIIVKIGEGLIALCGVIAEGAPAIGEAIKAVVLTIIDVIVEITPKLVGALVTILSTLLSAISENLPKFIQYGMAIIIGLLEGIRDNIDNVVTVVVEIIDTFITSVSNQIPKVAKSGIDLMVNFIDVLGSTIKTETPRIVEAVVGLGGNIVQGLIDGLLAGIGEIGNSAKAIGSSVINALKEVLDIHSPSKVLYTIGAFAGMGFVNGLTEYASKSYKAGVNIANSATEGINKIKTSMDFGSGAFESYVSNYVVLTNDVDKNTSILENASQMILDYGEKLYKQSDAYKKETEAVKENQKVLEDLKNERGEALDDLRYKLTASNNLMKENENLELELMHLERKGTEEVRGRIEAIKDKIEANNEHLKSLEPLKNAEEEIANLTQKNTKLEEELAEYNKKTDSYSKAKVETLKKEIAANEKQIDTLNEAVNVVDDFNSSIESTTESIKKNVTYLKENQNELKRLEKEKENNIELIDKELDKIDSLNNSNKVLQKERTKLSKENTSQSKTRLLEISEEITKNDEAINKSKEKIEEIKNNNRDLVSNIKLTKGYIEDQTKELENSFREAFENVRSGISDSISNFLDPLSVGLDTGINLFKEFNSEAEEVTKESVIANMKSQIDGIESFNEGLEKLVKLGLSGGLIDSVKDMGAESGMAYINAFLSMSKSELKTVDDLFTTSENLTSETLISNFQESLRAAEEWSDNMNALAKKGFSQEILNDLSDLGVSGSKYIEAFLSMTKSQIAEFNQLEEEALLLPDDVANSIVSSFVYAGSDSAEAYRKSLKAGVSNSVGEVLTNGITDGITGTAKDVETALKTLITGSLTASKKASGIEDASSSQLFYDEVGVAITSGISSGMKDESEISKLSESSKVVSTTAIDVFTSFQGNWVSIGRNISNGLAEGINDNRSSVINAAINTAVSAYEAACEALGVNSPSKKFMEIGMYLDEGLAIGMNKYAGLVEGSSDTLGNSTVDSIKTTISKVADIINSGMDTQPTIRPVLDLSNVEAGASKMNAFFSREQAMSISAGMSKSSTEANKNVDSASKTENSYTFTQNNYSPKALSRIDIYRQTKNQFSMTKGVIATT